MKKVLIFIIIIILYNINLYSQEISGVVYGINKDEKIPLNKATVRWLGTDIGTFTNKDGKFTLNKNKFTDTLVISYVGYKSDTVKVSSNNLVIELYSHLYLDEIVVSGKSEQFKISNSEIVNTFTITERGLRKAGCCNLAESFVTSAVADVEYSDAISGARQIKLLGLEGIYSQLLFENIPTMRGLASMYGLGYIPGPWMNSISVSKGTSSVINGFEGISGQINVEYKKPEDRNPFFLNIFGDQFGRLELNSDYSVKINDGLSTMILFHSNLNQFEHDMNDDTFSDHPLLTQVNLLNRWKYESEEMESVTGINFLYEDRKAGQIDYIRNNDNNFYGVKANINRIHFFSKNGFFLSDDGASLGTILSISNHEQKSNYGNRQFDAGHLSGYVNLIFDYPIKRNNDNKSCNNNLNDNENLFDIKSGISFQLDLYKYNLNYVNWELDEYIPGIFSEITTFLIKDFTISLGLRADWHNEYGMFLTPRLHLKYDFDDNTSLRYSLGKGSRTSLPLFDHSYVLTSAREIIVNDNLKREEALNTGASFNTKFSLFKIPIIFNIDYYYTNFYNQIITDIELSSNKVFFYNLNGFSYSHSFQFDLIADISYNFTLTTAYRYNDVRITYDNKLLQKPLQSPHKYLINLAYSTDDDDFLIDFTLSYNSSGRLPNTSQNPDKYQLGEKYDGYFNILAQITKRFNGWEIYLGGENLTNYVQPYPVLAYDQPFSKYFDSSLIYGPTMGRVIYFGIRISKDIK